MRSALQAMKSTSHLPTNLLLAVLLTISACGGDNNNDVASNPGDITNPAINTDPPGTTETPVTTDTPTVTGPPASTPTALPTPLANSDLPASLNQSFACDPSKDTPFTLVLEPNGQVQYSDNNGGTDVGTYQLSQNGVSLSFSSGVTAISTAYAVAGDLLVGMKLRDSESLDHDCIARAHNVGDKLTDNVAFTCGRRNLPGESSNTFTLFTDGSAEWENVFELPAGIDTLFETRLGTYLLDIASGSVLMAFKELTTDELMVFEVAASSEQIQVVSAPDFSSGAGVESQACEYL